MLFIFFQAFEKMGGKTLQAKTVDCNHDHEEYFSVSYDFQSNMIQIQISLRVTGKA